MDTFLLFVAGAAVILAGGRFHDARRGMQNAEANGARTEQDRSGSRSWAWVLTGTGSAATLLGPAAALMWGWRPAFLWWLGSAVLLGAMLRHAATLRSEAALNEVAFLSCPLARALDLAIQSTAMGLFAAWAAQTLGGYPGAWLAVVLGAVIAGTAGALRLRSRIAKIIAGLAGLCALFAGAHPAVAPGVIPAWTGAARPFPMATSGCLAAAFALALTACLLPRHGRAYRSLHALWIAAGAVLMAAGLLVAHPEISAAAHVARSAGEPPLFPMLLITLGAAVFPTLYARRDGRDEDASASRPESALEQLPKGTTRVLGMMGLLALCAVAGIPLGRSVSGGNFFDTSLEQAPAILVDGGARLVASLGVPDGWAQSILAAIVIAALLCATASAAANQWEAVKELARSGGAPPLRNPIVAALATLAPGLALAIWGGAALLPLLGALSLLWAAWILVLTTHFTAVKGWFRGLLALAAAGLLGIGAAGAVTSLARQIRNPQLHAVTTGGETISGRLIGRSPAEFRVRVAGRIREIPRSDLITSRETRSWPVIFISIAVLILAAATMAAGARVLLRLRTMHPEPDPVTTGGEGGAAP